MSTLSTENLRGSCFLDAQSLPDMRRVLGKEEEGSELKDPKPCTAETKSVGEKLVIRRSLCGVLHAKSSFPRVVSRTT